MRSSKSNNTSMFSIRIYQLISFSVLLISVYLFISKKVITKSIDVEVSKVRIGTLSDYVTATGELSPLSMVALYPKLHGEIKEVFVKQGDFVENGQMLFTLNKNSKLQEIEGLKSQIYSTQLRSNSMMLELENLEEKLELNKVLYEKGLIAREKLKDMKEKLRLKSVDCMDSLEEINRRKSELEKAKYNLESYDVVAPLSGIVTAVNINEGDVVGQSDFSEGLNSGFVNISDFSKMLAKLYVDEHNILKIKLGQPVEISINADPDNKFRGRVFYISAVTNQDRKFLYGDKGIEYEVKAMIFHFNPIFKTGMSVFARILTNVSRNTRIIPLQAVFYRNDRSHVYVVTDDKAKHREVKTGLCNSFYVEILDGLDPDDLVITGSAKLLEDLKADFRTYEVSAKVVEQESFAGGYELLAYGDFEKDWTEGTSVRGKNDFGSREDSETVIGEGKFIEDKEIKKHNDFEKSWSKDDSSKKLEGDFNLEEDRKVAYNERELFYVQLGAYYSREDAAERAKKVKAYFPNNLVKVSYITPYYKVLFEGFEDLKLAEETKQMLRRKGFLTAWVARYKLN